MSEAWLMCDAVVDQRLENRRVPNAPVTYEELAELGVSVRQLSNVDTMLAPGPNGEPSEVDRIMAQQGFKNRDEVVCSPDKLANYDEKLKMFFEEHIHEDDEIRLVKAGSGYFDVRNATDEWVRIRVLPGDFLVIPAGIYHRFTMDEQNFTHAVRLFSEAPKWTPINRPCEDNEVRARYVREYVTNPPPKNTLMGPADGQTILYLARPNAFDSVVKSVIRGKITNFSPEKKDLLIIFFTGTVNANTGKSWCPDCVDAAEPLRQAVQTAMTKRRVVFLQVGVERASYLNHPEYPLRTHPFVGLKSIPTVIVCEAKGEQDGVEDDEGAGLTVLGRFENFTDDWLATL